MTPTPEQPDVREIAARAHWTASNGRRLRDGEAPTLGSVHYAHADAVLAAVTPVIRRQVAEEAAQAIEAEAVAANWAKTFRNGLEHAAAIARSHSTQPTEEETTR